MLRDRDSVAQLLPSTRIAATSCNRMHEYQHDGAGQPQRHARQGPQASCQQQGPGAAWDYGVVAPLYHVTYHRSDATTALVGDE